MYATRSLRMIQPTRRMLNAAGGGPPKDEHAAHTISQRLRRLKSIPPELIPLGVVVGVAVCFGAYSLSSKLWKDKTMRLYRQGKAE